MLKQEQRSFFSCNLRRSSDSFESQPGSVCLFPLAVYFVNHVYVVCEVYVMLCMCMLCMCVCCVCVCCVCALCMCVKVGEAQYVCDDSRFSWPPLTHSPARVNVTRHFGDSGENFGCISSLNSGIGVLCPLEQKKGTNDTHCLFSQHLPCLLFLHCWTTFVGRFTFPKSYFQHQSAYPSQQPAPWNQSGH